MPVPLDSIIDHRIHDDSFDFTFEFFSPLPEWRINVPRSRCPDMAAGEFYNTFHSIIGATYSDFAQRQDELLLRDALRGQMGPMYAYNELRERLRAYYRGGSNITERYFSLRDLDAEEEHYGLRQIRPNVFEREYPLYLSGPTFYGWTEVAPEVIARRQDENRICIEAILSERCSPSLFEGRVSRYRAIVQAEREALRGFVSRRGRRHGSISFSEEYASVSGPALERSRARQREQIWREDLIRRHGNPRRMYEMSWDIAGSPTEDKEAAARGIKLLRENLTAVQLKAYDAAKCFYVTGGVTGDLYEITEGKQQNVFRVDKESRKRIAGLCFLPSGNLCIGDTMLTQKIALELHEKEALKVARPFGNYSDRNMRWDV